MEKIEIGKRDLEKLKSLSYLDKADRKFYLIDGELAKIYIDLPSNENKQYRLQKKLELLQPLNDIDGLVIPTKQIFYNGEFSGFTQTFYDESICFKDYDVTSNEEYVKILKTISNLLKAMHEANVIWGDLNFSNILITNDGVKFIDLDGSGVGLFEPDYFSRQAYNFSTYNSLSNKMLTTKEFDKLSLFIEFMCYHFLTINFTRINKEEYKMFCKKINSELKKYLNIANNYFKICYFKARKDLPYIGDIINCDIYEDRSKRLELKRNCFFNSIHNGIFYD